MVRKRKNGMNKIIWGKETMLDVGKVEKGLCYVILLKP